MDEKTVLGACLTALGIGLLMGLERERAHTGGPGLRSFALVALTGATAALIVRAGDATWLLGVVVLAVTVIAVASLMRAERNGTAQGMTTNAALLLCCLLGALAAFGQIELAAALGVAATALMYFRPELHGFSQRLSTTEMRAILQFAAVAFLVLPLLPNTTWDPWQVLNPFRIGLLVVLISGLSLAGYTALKLFDHRQAVLAMGLLGGAVSSTATTLAFARHARDGAIPSAAAALIVSLANLTVLVRLGVITVAAAPALLPKLVPVLASALVAGLVLPLRAWLRLRSEQPRPDLDVKNPADLSAALGFALLFTIVLVITAVANDALGAAGLYAVAAVSGLTDVDAISLSAMQMHAQDRVAAVVAVVTIAIAYSANLAFKLGAVGVIGGREMLRSVAANFACALIGMVAGILLWL